VGGRPDRLHHVPQVEPACLEGSVLEVRQDAPAHRPLPRGVGDPAASASQRGLELLALADILAAPLHHQREPDEADAAALLAGLSAALLLWLLRGAYVALLVGTAAFAANVFVEPGAKWRMTADSFPVGAMTQFTCPV